VGRVWPRHGHRGRPLNSIVRCRNMSAVQIAIRIMFASIVYAAATAITEAVRCTQQEATACLGVDASPPLAIAFISVLLLGCGLVAMALVLSPVVILISRRRKISSSLAIVLGAIAGVVPLAIACFASCCGCLVSNWFPHPTFTLAMAGAIGGGLLWRQWFRHLTTRSSGP
jgi:hypothetical protein